MTGQEARLPPLADADGFVAAAPARASFGRDHLPGLLVVGFASLAAAYLSEHYGVPVTLMALLIGLATNFLNADPRLHPGLDLAARTLLRVGIVLIGARISLAQLEQLGWPAMLAIVVILVSTLAAGALCARLLGYGWAFGALAGGAVAICGASAAMAFAALLGDRRVSQAQVALVLVGISAASALAMIGYPIIARLLALDDVQAGFVFGAAIHDVAQSLAAGAAFSPMAGDTASIVKLTRVALLAPALAVTGWVFRKSGEPRDGRIPVPWFVAGFFLLAGINSLGLVPHAASVGASALAAALLVCAVTAIGIRSNLHSLLAVGLRPLLVVVAATIVALALALVAARYVIR